MKLRILVAVGALTMAGGAAWAQNVSGADANGDGRVTRAEAQAAREAMFDRIDADGDGAVTSVERQALAAARASARGAEGRAFQRADANGDGAVSRQEFLNQPIRAFNRFDANGDDVLDSGEIEAMRSAMQRLQR